MINLKLIENKIVEYASELPKPPSAAYSRTKNSLLETCPKADVFETDSPKWHKKLKEFKKKLANTHGSWKENALLEVNPQNIDFLLKAVNDISVNNSRSLIVNIAPKVTRENQHFALKLTRLVAPLFEDSKSIAPVYNNKTASIIIDFSEKLNHKLLFDVVKELSTIKEGKNLRFQNDSLYNVLSRLTTENKKATIELAKLQDTNGKFLYDGFDIWTANENINKTNEKGLINFAKTRKPNIDTLITASKLNGKQLDKITKHSNLLDSDIIKIQNLMEAEPEANFDGLLEDILKPYTNFSKKVNIIENDCNIVSVPSEDFLNEKEIVAVIDNYDYLYENGYNNLKYTHGDYVTKKLTAGLKDKIGVLAYNTNSHGINYDGKSPLAHAMEDLLDKKRNKSYGDSIKKLNVSLANMMSFDDFSEHVGKVIDFKNIFEKKGEILDFLKTSTTFKTIYKTIETINKLVDSGVEVFIGAGNDGRKQFNLYALSKAKIIGAANAKGVIDDYSSESSLVSAYARGTFGVLEHIEGEDVSKIVPRKNLASKNNIKKCLAELKKCEDSWVDKMTVLERHKLLNEDYDKIYELNDDFFKLRVYKKNIKQFLDYEFKTHMLLEKMKYKEDEKYVEFYKKFSNIFEIKKSYFKEMNGKIFKDFDGSGNPQQIGVHSGTSYSTPTYINELLSNKSHIAPSSRIDSLAVFKKYVDMMQELKRSRVLEKGKSVENLVARDFFVAGVNMDEFLLIRSKVKNFFDKGFDKM